MITIKLGYDNCMQGGTSQWSTIYITDNFKDFYDYDGERFYKNELSPVIYNKKVQEMREEFLIKFKHLEDIDDLMNNLRGLIYISDDNSGFEWW